MLLSKRLLALDESAFIELMETGQLYSLYPELKGVLFNVGQFKQAKEQYENVNQAEEAAFEYLVNICAFTGHDPEDIYNLMEEHKENIMLMLEAEELDLEHIFDSVRDSL